jgi:hypothetical protein
MGDDDRPWSTTPRELCIRAIESRPSRRQSSFVRLQRGLTLREAERSRPPKTTIAQQNDSNNGVTYVPGLICHPCSRLHGLVSRPRCNRLGSVSFATAASL